LNRCCSALPSRWVHPEADRYSTYRIGGRVARSARRAIRSARSDTPTGGFAVLSSSTPERRAVPPFLLGLLTLPTVAAAVAGIRFEPSPNQLALQAAFQKTSQADRFSYAISGTASGQGSEQSQSFQAWGAWQSPDRLRLDPSPLPSKATMPSILSGTAAALRSSSRKATIHSSCLPRAVAMTTLTSFQPSQQSTSR